MSEELREKSLLTHKKQLLCITFSQDSKINGDGTCEVLYFLSKQNMTGSHDVIFD